MRTIFNSKKHLNVKRIGIFLIAVALVAGVLSCNGTTPSKYDLTMAEDPAAGGTATDETGGSPYASGTKVDIKAVANTGYEFAGWTAPAGTFVDEDAAETTFTMPPQDVTVTANFVLVYDLTMAVNPTGGGAATDETGTSPYPAGTDASIKAVATPPYQFFKWTASAGAFADENAATTTFTMPAEDVTATANFVGPLDHATVYYVNDAIPEYIDEEVFLEDQFGNFTATVDYVEGFAIPAEKMYNDETTPIYNPDHCLTIYYISCEEELGLWDVEVENQFGTQNLTVEGPYGLAVPTQNEGHEAPLGLDHYLLYYVWEYTYLDEISVTLNDEFMSEPLVSEVYEPMVFANPVKKTRGTEVTEILNPDVHAVGYMTDWGDVSEAVDIVNQFGEQTLDVDGPYGLILPSQKISWEPMFEHFRMYAMDEGTAPYVGEPVQLQDQFRDEPLVASVEEGLGFCTNVDKYHDGWGYWAYHWSYHLTVYNLTYEEEPQMWEVTVDNQFGEDQVLLVYGPLGLAVPTHKLYPDDEGPPVGLDHFLLYAVVDYIGPSPDVPVELADQFNYEPEVWVYEPIIFANPVQKTYGEEVTEIENPEWHMVFYNAPGAPLDPTVEVGIDNQFGEQGFTVTWPDALGVPSAKVDWTLVG